MPDQNKPADQPQANINLDAFAWTYDQQTGELQHDGVHVSTGYSGAGDGKNNPQMQDIHNVGPIPAGDWTISGPPANTTTHGPYVLKLSPEAATETFGRSDFLIHGDSKQNPGTASQGCIILPRSARQQVWDSGDRDLQVVPNIPSDERNHAACEDAAGRIQLAPGVESPDKA